MILEERSETGGVWTVDLRIDGEFKWVMYNNVDVTNKILGTKREKPVYDFFESRYDFSELIADYLHEIHNNYAVEY